MEVVYVKEIWNRVLEAKSEAAMNNKRIDYIKLTKEEAEQMYDYMETRMLEVGHPPRRYPWMFYDVTDYKVKQIHDSQCFGVKLKVSGY